MKLGQVHDPDVERGPAGNAKMVETIKDLRAPKTLIWPHSTHDKCF